VTNDDRIFRVTDHCCRYCMGRVLISDAIVVCAQCGREESVSGGLGRVATARLCCCGLSDIVGTRGAGRAVRQPFRCVPNPARTEVNSAEIVGAFGNLVALVEAAGS
jgi:hypothetical protein